ncbi:MULTISPECIES: AraC family transcriptional regulator [Sphingobacterium]|uniref:AraC family transcriptional regulator n=1 Tax=Sphingobacterium TaxID=28453 RepID=UPI0013DD2B8F|nr:MULTISPECIES: AraC family transcriptional regulator [unclassified Sphingobacterium]
MKLKQLSLDRTYYNSFHIRQDSYPRNHNSWHYHEELEFIWIYKGSGTLFIGDCIQNFAEGDAVLIGSNLPHYWLFENFRSDNLDAPIDCIVVHFKKDFAGSDFFNLPEMVQLKQLIQDSEKGLMIRDAASPSLGQHLKSMLDTEGVLKFTFLLQSLAQYATLPYEKLVSDNYAILNHSNDERRMNDVMNYIREYYKGKIELSKLANQAKMTKNSFCRYFKYKTGKTPIQFVSEIRVAHACRLLKNTNLSLKEICYDSGFNNFVSFHKTFKEQLKLTPTEYRKN